MNHESVESLPSLVCPLIMRPAIRNKKPLHQPPFPGIDLRWDGFIIPSLRLVGLNRTNLDSWRIKLALWHELFHGVLASRPFSLAAAFRLQCLYILIYKTFKEKQGQIEVPLTADESGNDLQKELKIVSLLKRESMLIEEVFAVRSSLLRILEERLIEPAHLPTLIREYQIGYEKYIHGYTAAYDAFDFMAKGLGDTNAIAMIYNVLGTASPNDAFNGILFGLCHYNPNVSNDLAWTLRKELRSDLADLSFKKAYDVFGRLLSAIDPDDSRYRRCALLDRAERIETAMRNEAQNSECDLFKSLFGSPTTLLLTFYDDCIFPFLKPIEPTRPEDIIEKSGFGYYPFKSNDSIENDGFGSFLITLESILQQLTQGIGLLCPWFISASHCCGGSTRELLENVWECTSPALACKRWERLGCLDK